LVLGLGGSAGFVDAAHDVGLDEVVDVVLGGVRHVDVVAVRDFFYPWVGHGGGGVVVDVMDAKS
jgi:hypothetical protein